MNRWRRQILWIFAALLFLVTFFGLLTNSNAGQLVVTWASFLAAIALLLGVINLFLTHLRRTGASNIYSTVLVLAMVLVWLAPLINLAMDGDWAYTIFNLVQVPLEAAFGSLMVFFLLIAGMRLLRGRQERVRIALFGLGAGIALLSTIGFPSPLHDLLQALHTLLEVVVVSAGVKGILIGVALGTITSSLRILSGAQRPYSQ